MTSGSEGQQHQVWVQGQAKEGVQEVIVGEQSGNSPEKN
jgi:hypothetical protein